MELRQLSAFCAVVESGSVTEAARRLGYAQSSVTAQIQGLEAAVGAALFERAGRGLRATSAGRMVYDRARGVLRGVNDLRGAIAEMSDGLSGDVRLGAIESAASERVPTALAVFLRDRPRVRVRFETGGTATLCSRVAAGDLDLAVTALPPRDACGQAVTFSPLYLERLALLVGARSPLASRESVTLRELANERVLLTDAVCFYNACFRNAAKGAGVTVDVALESANIATLIRAVELGMGVAVLPAGQLERVPARTHAVRISGNGLRVGIGLVRALRPASAAVEALAAALAASLPATRAGRAS